MYEDMIILKGHHFAFKNENNIFFDSVDMKLL